MDSDCSSCFAPTRCSGVDSPRRADCGQSLHSGPSLVASSGLLSATPTKRCRGWRARQPRCQRPSPSQFAISRARPREETAGRLRADEDRSTVPRRHAGGNSNQSGRCTTYDLSIRSHSSGPRCRDQSDPDTTRRPLVGARLAHCGRPSGAETNCSRRPPTKLALEVMSVTDAADSAPAQQRPHQYPSMLLISL